ncbi:MAG: hypothetical protein DWQ36_02690 [Acidobacteria bacterium]|nr:MAG: hypothetical protein DWQ30_24080 [Acidobacteriota bacterium]REK11344.1 MAG: hypothetical protein DWQ36_02690 [Acidobacteriota bacterium]
MKDAEDQRVDRVDRVDPSGSWIRRLVDRWGLQVTLYAFMWIVLLAAIAVGALVLGPRSCVEPEPRVDPAFDRRLP